MITTSSICSCNLLLLPLDGFHVEFFSGFLVTFSFWLRSFIIQKLYSLVDQTSLPDNPDSLQNQEILVPGHLITIYLKVYNYFPIW